jgi:hypothetical protein
VEGGKGGEYEISKKKIKKKGKLEMVPLITALAELGK